MPPRSLLWRTFLLIAVLILLSVFAWFSIFARSEREPRAKALAQMVESVVNLTHTALVTADPAKRRLLLLELNEREGIRIYPSVDGEYVAPLPDQPGIKLLEQELKQRLGPDTRITYELDGEPAFWVSFNIDGDDYWIALPRERVERGSRLQWIGWGLAVLLLALAGAYLIVFRVTRPLKALANAAADIGRGRRPPPLEEAGPEEIETVARAFNQMSADLARLDADRALILAGISHDLRTPLARLRLAAEMSGADGAVRDGMIADIEEIDRTIGQFLDFARATSGEGLDSVDLDQLIRECAEHYARRGKPVRAEAGGLPALPLRPKAMRRVLANLVDNALRYAGEDQPIEIRTRREKNETIVEVLDRGPGIPPNEAERLKRPFTRLETARSNAAGAGLGLAIVERIVQDHHGRFDLLPREGGGLIARVTIPTVQYSQAAA
ncbi:MAG: ATP-binding protein [Pseudomonadota bacterium]